MRNDALQTSGRSAGLVDVLDRVLDKGLVIAGDIKVSLAEVELLTIRIRLIVCSLDKAQEVGLDWWRYDPHLAPGRRNGQDETEELRERIRALEARLAARESRSPRAPKTVNAGRTGWRKNDGR